MAVDLAVGRRNGSRSPRGTEAPANAANLPRSRYGSALERYLRQVEPFRGLQRDERDGKILQGETG
jgi:hypothetical protein